MKKCIVVMLSILIGLSAAAQTAVVQDSAVTGKITVNKDPRLDLLAKKEAEFNKLAALGPKAAQGYRLLVVNSNDRNYAMKIRAQLLKAYPEQKVYMTFQAPFIKLKFGNFVDMNDAEKYRKLITSAKIVTNNVYVVAEIVEVKADKNKETADEE
ncbi:MAG: hypothetical protein WCI49_16395 [Ferruginibacter sp.]